MTPSSWPAHAVEIYATLIHLTPNENRHEWNRHKVPAPGSVTVTLSNTLSFSTTKDGVSF